MSGCELIERIRANARLAKLPVVMLTAKGFELDERQLLGKLRVNTIIMKPFSPRELIATIRTYMDATAPALSSKRQGRWISS
jgi:DNA-binding response OmpR family regulator